MGNRLSGQVAWISGAGSGIGAATAALFIEEGARVALVDLHFRADSRPPGDITPEASAALLIQADVAIEDDVERSIEQAVAHFGGLNIIVNCAGVVHVKPLHEYESSEWDRLMGVNLKSIFFSVKHGLTYLRSARPSYVVNVGSISSFVGQAATPAYTASKSAVLGLTRSIALDYAALGVRCNCVCPGITDTPHAARASRQDTRPGSDLERTTAPGPVARAAQAA